MTQGRPESLLGQTPLPDVGWGWDLPGHWLFPLPCIHPASFPGSCTLDLQQQQATSSFKKLRAHSWGGWLAPGVPSATCFLQAVSVRGRPAPPPQEWNPQSVIWCWEPNVRTLLPQSHRQGLKMVEWMTSEFCTNLDSISWKWRVTGSW